MNIDFHNDQKTVKPGSNINWLKNNWDLEACETVSITNHRLKDKIIIELRKIIVPQISKQSLINIHTIGQLSEFEQRLLQLETDNKVLLAQSILNNLKFNEITDIQDAEFRVFSQWGEDGIIQWIIHTIQIENPIFIEFGVENYLEANTRFLLINNNWKGLVIDSSKTAIDEIRSRESFWKYDLQAISSFINRENINDLFKDAGIIGDIGLLSIDIDGNDYWIWDAISVVSPRIVICEYNSVFGVDYAITIPYDPTFQRNQAHYSNLYFGASLRALCILAEKKGYKFIGSNRAGNNAFFIRNDLSSKFPDVSVYQGYVDSKFRESRDINGSLTYISGINRLQLIKDLPVVNILDNSQIKLSEIL